MKWLLLVVALLVILLLLLIIIKVSIDFRLDYWEEKKAFQVAVYLGFLPVYHKQFDLKDKADFLSGKDDDDKSSEGGQPDNEKLKKEILDHRLWNDMKRMANVFTIHQLDSRMIIGTGMASSTGTISGLMMGLAGVLELLFIELFIVKSRPQLKVTPSFQEKCFRVQADGIFSFRIGKAMYVWFRHVNQRSRNAG
ncbi:DUF2953 domain-containing protein [Thalassobacillus hwangdonensis]|uniref:DUF2953 domain-containing protein n=1 Tax=Thalassobacillus hwangdonensis TaxID=546108 RepID=A0ABW3L380_9BACI